VTIKKGTRTSFCLCFVGDNNSNLLGEPSIHILKSNEEEKGKHAPVKNKIILCYVYPKLTLIAINDNEFIHPQ
jgi:hypothetical protein